MNDAGPLPPDDLLHAFVDGQLPPGQVAAVLDHLQRHPDAALRVAQWQAQRLALRQWHRAIDPGPAPAALTRPLRRRPWTRRPGLAMAAAVLLLVGVAGGWFAHRGLVARDAPALAAREFYRDALVAHAVYTPESRHPVEVPAAEEAHLVAWLSRRLGTPLKAPVLQAQGFRLLGGRLLPGEPGAPGARAQFMYEDDRARRVTLYVTVFGPHERPAETAFRTARHGPLESFYWVEGHFGYALSAELPAADVQALAREVYRQLSP